MILTDETEVFGEKTSPSACYSNSDILGDGSHAPVYGSCAGRGAVGESFLRAFCLLLLIAFQCSEKLVFYNIHLSERSDLSIHNISY
jgi:hypothetical protein